ncbi:MAG: ABC transporter permease [Acidobacteriia bacterium]|nr:ABC transporter permease [Terriglobia bacterium]
MNGILEDLRFGLRALARNRGFAAVAIVSLALGIGANTTIFTLVNALLLRPLPVADGAALASVYTVDSREPGLLYCSYPNFQDYRDQNRVFSSVFLYSSVALNLTGQGAPQLIMGEIVSGNYFSTLGVTLPLGRGFLAEEDAVPGAYPVAVISDRFWKSHLGGDPRAAGRTLTLNGRAYTVVGVAPAGFAGLDTLSASDIWVPMAMYQQVYPNAAWVARRRALLFAMAGRLKPGVGIRQAEAALQVVAQNLERQYPEENSGRRVRLIPLAESALPPKVRPSIARAGAVLLVVSGLVLLIACANVSSLVLARGAGRNREIAIRMALGVSRWLLVRQLLVESLLLAVAGGAAGLLLARWMRDILWALRPPILVYAALHLDLDGRVLGYTAAISLVTGILFGLAPALRATRTDLAVDLKERMGTGGTPSGASRRWHTRALLVVGQVTFSVVALVGAGLFVRSLRQAGRIDTGFDAGHLGVITFDAGSRGYDETRGRDFQERALERAATVPGVVSATLARDYPFRVALARTVLLPGREGRITLMGVVWPGYFHAVGIPLERGREFSATDTKSTRRVAVVNEAAAALFWPREDAVGKRIQFSGDRTPVEVVGVARNANYQTIGEQPQALIYLSLIQYYFPVSVLYVRTAGDPNAVLGAAVREVQALDRDLLLDADAVPAIIDQSLWAQRLSAGLLTLFGAIALVLAAVGIYGVISYSVKQRVREIGVRMALGATTGDMRTMVLGEGIRLVAVGVLAGTAIALGASRAVASMLFATSARDTATFVLVPATLALVALLACWLPARRAARIDPGVALRDE